MSANPHPKTRLTLAEFHDLLKQRGHDRYIELIDGELVEKMPNDEHGYLVGELTRLLGNFLRENRLGRVSVEVRISQPNMLMGNSRLPDLAVLLGKRPVQSSALEEAPDIVFEVQSPGDSRAGLITKAEFYLAIGVKEVWLVYPAMQRVEIITADTVKLFDTDDIIAGDSLLPGFTLNVGELFNYEDFE